MKRIVLALVGSALLAACGSSSDSPKSKDTDVPTYWPAFASKKWRRDVPGWSLWMGAPFTERDKSSADDLTRNHESVFSHWKSTLNHGFVPSAYLEHPTVTYEDTTKGSLPGIEKMKPVLDRINQTCGAFLPNRKQGLALRVVWIDSSIRKQSLLGTDTLGAFRSGAMTAMNGFIGDQNGDPNAPHSSEPPSLDTQVIWTPENIIYVWGGLTEDERKESISNAFAQYGYDSVTKQWKQTWMDYFGVLPGARPKVEEPERVWGGWSSGYEPLYRGKRLADQIFAHELGHAFLLEWAMTHGRNPNWTKNFDEMFAEMFAQLCYNDQYEMERVAPVVPNATKVPPMEWKPTEGGRGLPVPRMTPGKDKDGRAMGYRPFSKSECGVNLNCDSMATFARMFPHPLMVDGVVVQPPETEGGFDELVWPPKPIMPFDGGVEMTLIAEKKWSQEERLKIFDAMLGALDEMQGVRLAECAPLTVADELKWPDAMGDVTVGKERPHPDAGVCPWGMNEADRKLPLAERPLVFTSREFWPLFLERYQLPERHRAEAQGIADALNLIWEY